ncbi:MAG: HAD hydrolase family protein [Sedimentisphaerales bacterium]|nr:HAD hydrolase family protein [Sedimentisphaerales bacterium]
MSDKLDIKLLVMDVDGVLTDGTIIVHPDGSESKNFHAHDGGWIRIWRRLGLQTAIITGRECPAVEHRAKMLEIEFVYQKALDKLLVFDQLIEESGVSAQEVAFIGDDVFDLPIIRRAGFSAAVADAVPEIRQAANMTTKASGGKGAVGEFIRFLLKEMGLWEKAMEKYNR